MKEFAKQAQDQITDVLEKCSSARTRAGSAVERVGKMLENGVAADVIALQMTRNSKTGKTYTEDGVKTLGDVYADSCAGVAITAKQASALIKDAHAAELEDDDGLEPCPTA